MTQNSLDEEIEYYTNILAELDNAWQEQRRPVIEKIVRLTAKRPPAPILIDFDNLLASGISISHDGRLITPEEFFKEMKLS